MGDTVRTFHTQTVDTESGWNLEIISQRHSKQSEGPQGHLKGHTVRCKPQFPEGREELTNGDHSATGIKPQSGSPTRSSNNAEKAGNGSVHHGP